MLVLPEQAGRISLVACDTHTDTHMLVEKTNKDSANKHDSRHLFS